MAPRSRTPGEGQKHLEMPTVEPHPGIVHVLTPEYLGIEPADYDDITDQMITGASPTRLRQSLIDVSAGSDGAVGFMPIGQRKPFYVAVTSTSYDILARSPSAVKRYGVNRTERLRKQKREEAAAEDGSLATFGLSIDTINDDKAAAKRAGAHINERLEQDMRRHLGDAILPRLELIRKFKEASQHPNLSRLGGREAMRENFTDLSRNVVGDMVSAVSMQKGWTGEQVDLATRSIIKGIAIAGRPGVRARRLFSMLGLGEEWFGYNRVIFLERINWAGRVARQAHREAEKYAPRPS